MTTVWRGSRSRHREARWTVLFIARNF